MVGMGDMMGMMKKAKQMQKDMEKMQKDLQEMDYRGSFESDDETGVIFKQIQTTINQLTRFRGEEQ